MEIILSLSVNIIITILLANLSINNIIMIRSLTAFGNNDISCLFFVLTVFVNPGFLLKRRWVVGGWGVTLSQTMLRYSHNYGVCYFLNFFF